MEDIARATCIMTEPSRVYAGGTVFTGCDDLASIEREGSSMYWTKVAYKPCQRAACGYI